jgi:integrase
VIKGIHPVRKRRVGKPDVWYIYAWRGGPCIMRAEGSRPPKLGKKELDAIAAAIDEQGKSDVTKLAGLIRELSIADGGAREWKNLATSTRRTWETHLNRIEAKWGETPVKLWSNPRMTSKVVAWRDSYADTPRAADLAVQVLGFLLEFARLRGHVTINVAAGIPTLYRPIGREEIIWTDDDLDQFAVAAIAVNRPHLIDAVWLACLTGLRKADLVALTWDEVGDHAITRTAKKKSRGRRRRAAIPMYPALQALLDELRTRDRAQGVKNVLVNSKGLPWGDLTSAVCQVRDLARIVEPANDELDLPERAKHLHDCRGTFVTHLCRQRLTDREIADIAAWSPDNVASIRRRYVDDAAVVVALGKRIASRSV